MSANSSAISSPIASPMVSRHGSPVAVRPGTPVVAKDSEVVHQDSPVVDQDSSVARPDSPDVQTLMFPEKEMVVLRPVMTARYGYSMGAILTRLEMAWYHAGWNALAKGVEKPKKTVTQQKVEAGLLVEEAKPSGAEDVVVKPKREKQSKPEASPKGVHMCCAAVWNDPAKKDFHPHDCTTSGEVPLWCKPCNRSAAVEVSPGIWVCGTHGKEERAESNKCAKCGSVDGCCGHKHSYLVRGYWHEDKFVNGECEALTIEGTKKLAKRGMEVYAK